MSEREGMVMRIRSWAFLSPYVDGRRRAGWEDEDEDDEDGELSFSFTEIDGGRWDGVRL